MDARKAFALAQKNSAGKVTVEKNELTDNSESKRPEGKSKSVRKRRCSIPKSESPCCNAGRGKRIPERTTRNVGNLKRKERNNG